MHLLATASLSLLAALSLLLPAVVAQEHAGLRATLSAPSLVQANGTVALRLLLEATADVELTPELLNGADLRVVCDDVELAPLQRPGRGAKASLVAGTRIDRTLVFRAAQFLPADARRSTARVTVGWTGLPGVGCNFQIAPDARGIELGTLDLQQTQVVLVTSHGDLRLSFRPDKAPRHVENFVRLCLQGFYDGTKFHRVVRDFMIQGGCPNTRHDERIAEWGAGGPGYTIDAEFSDLRHLRGTLSMARGSDPNSAGSGFFLVHRDAPHLDGRFSAFGNLEAGADALDRIAEVPCSGPKLETPRQPVVLLAAVVLPVFKK